MTFTNTETKEYIFFEISIDVIPREPFGTFVFDTSVREFADDVLKLTNPVDIPVTFAVSCSLPQVLCEKSMSMDPYTTVTIINQYNCFFTILIKQRSLANYFFLFQTSLKYKKQTLLPLSS